MEVSTLSAVILIERFRAKTLIMTGVAGAINPDLEIGDFVVSRDMIQHDVDCSAMNNPPGQMCGMDRYIYSADTYLLDITMEVIGELYVNAGALNGRILTGDQYINGVHERIVLFDMFAGDCVEMEGAAVGQVVYNYHQEVPFVDIRVISDKADGEAPDDEKKFEKMAEQCAENIILHMLKRI
jgi:adenosylhomocysteine nucleosidase